LRHTGLSTNSERLEETKSEIKNLKKELTGDLDGFKKKYLIGLKIIFCFRNKGCS
jgi:hypothetical protein